MAQTSYTPISLYYSTTASAAPTAGNLVNGELAINITDGKIFYKDNSGVVQTIASKATGTVAGSTTQVIYNNAGAYAGSANFTFNGTTVTIANDASISGLTVGKGGGAVSSNTVLGNLAGANNSTGAQNVYIGQIAGFSATGSNNTIVGYASGYNTTGSNNAGFGHFALYNNTSGATNTAVGVSALSANTTASNNTAVGYLAGTSNTTGASNTALGAQALYSNTTASNNTAVGYQAAYSNTTGTDNTVLGYAAGYAITTGSYNVAVGRLAMQNSAGVTGNENTAIGNTALRTLTSGAYNTAIGSQALGANTTASNNTAVGYQAGYSNTTSANQCFLGYQAGYAATGNGNTFIGNQAGYNVTTGTRNTFVGVGGSDDWVGGRITTGSKNTIIGGYSGNQGGLDIRTASNYIVLSDGDGNPRGIFDGSGRLCVNVTSAYTTGSYISVYGATALAARVVSDGDYAIRFLNAGSATLVGSVSVSSSSTAYNTSSDYRLKEDIAPMTGALAKVAQLKPVTYKWKATGEESQGFIAHELQEIVPECVTGKKDAVDEEGNPQYQGIDTSFLVATLTAAIQELNAKLEAQALEIATLKAK